jgi:NTP pyrophosphatase (non-canonical NTP hydrolase)
MKAVTHEDGELSLWQIGRQFNKVSGAKPTLRAMLDRMQLELDEAYAALMHESEERALEEVADVILTAASGCHANGLDVEYAVQDKHRVNMARKWEAHPDIPGAVRRIK